MPWEDLISWMSTNWRGVVRERLGTQDRLFSPSGPLGCLFVDTTWKLTTTYSSIARPHSLYGPPFSVNVPTHSSQYLGVSALAGWQPTTIYTIWRDRNSRYHTNSYRDSNNIIRAIAELVQCKLMSFSKVENNTINESLQEKWLLPNSIFL